MHRIRISPAAIEDLAQIRAYLLREAGVQTAGRVLGRIYSRFEQIAEQPGIGRLREDLGEGGTQVRSSVLDPYVIFYSDKGDQTLILRVLHGARDVRPEAVVEDELPDTDA